MRSTEAAIRTERLILSPLGPEHAGVLFPLLNDWEVARMLAEVPWPVTLDGLQAFAARQRQKSEADNFAITFGGELIGTGSVKRPGSGNPPRVMPRLGYWLGRPFWNRGYGTEAVAALVAHGFQSYPGEVVGAGVFQDNVASRRVLEKLGFEVAGRYETPCLARGGAVATLDMRLTRAKWRQGRP